MSVLTKETHKCSYLLSNTNIENFEKYILSTNEKDAEDIVILGKTLVSIYLKSEDEELPFETLLENEFNIQNNKELSHLKSMLKPIKKYLVLSKLQNDDASLNQFITKHFENEASPNNNNYSLLNDNCIHFKRLNTTWGQIKDSLSYNNTPGKEVSELLKKSVIELEKHNIYFKLTQYYISLNILSISFARGTHFEEKEVLKTIDKAILMNDKGLDIYARCLLLALQPSNKRYFRLKKDFFSMREELSDEHLKLFGISLINYCTHKTNKGVDSFHIEAYDLYKKLHNHGVLFSKTFFTNKLLDHYVGILIKVKKPSEAQIILDKYIDLVPKKVRVLQWSYNKTNILFSQKEYTPVINIIDNLIDTDLKNYYYKLKGTLIKSLIETNQYDRVFIECNEVSKHIKIDNTISQDVLYRLQITFDYLNKIARIKKEGLSGNEIKEAKTSLKANKEVLEKEWITQTLNKMNDIDTTS